MNYQQNGEGAQSEQERDAERKAETQAPQPYEGYGQGSPTWAGRDEQPVNQPPSAPPPVGYWPPAQAYGGAPPQQPPERRSRGWLYVLGAVLVLIALVIGIAIGFAVTRTGGQSSSSTGTGQPAPTVAVPPSAQDLQQTTINVIRTVQPSVVEVVSRGSQGEGIGSGEVVSADGYIVTNDHVVSGFNSFTVNLSNGQSQSAQIVGQDPQDDLAVLKISASNLQPINYGESSKVQVGQFAIAMGSPLGLEQSATFGIISALNRSAAETPNGPATTLTGLIQTSAPINPGNSGGALVDMQGRLIGIPTLGVVNPSSGAAAEGIGFAIPSDRVKFVVDQLIKNGKLVQTGQGFLGIRGQDVTPELAAAYNLPAQAGVLVTGFSNDASGKSPAENAGVRMGDIIIAVNNHHVSSNGDLSSALLSQQPGTKVTLTVQRGSSQQKIPVTLGERPAGS